MERQAQAIPATKFEFGPGALEVGFRRKQLEGDQAKLDLGKKQLADKQVERFKYDPDTVFRSHSQAAAEGERAYIAAEGEMVNKWKSGQGGNPYEIGTPENMALQEMQFERKQFAAGSIQAGKEYAAGLKELNKPNSMYLPEAKEAFRAAYEDPRIATGEIPTPVLASYFDFDKAYEKALNQLSPEVIQSAVSLKSGKNLMTRTEELTDSKILEQAVQTAQQPQYIEAAEYRFKKQAEKNPEEARALFERAQAAGRNTATQMAYEDMKTAAYKKREKKLTGSERSMEDREILASAKRIVEVTKGIAEGSYEGLKPAMAYQFEWFGLPQQVGNQDVPDESDNYEVTEALNDFNITKEEYETGTGKNAKRQTRDVGIKAILRDKRDGRVKIAYKNGKSSEWMSGKEYADRSLAALQEFNKGVKGIDAFVDMEFQINEQGGFDIVDEKNVRTESATPLVQSQIRKGSDGKKRYSIPKQ